MQQFEAEKQNAANLRLENWLSFSSLPVFEPNWRQIGPERVEKPERENGQQMGILRSHKMAINYNRFGFVFRVVAQRASFQSSALPDLCYRQCAAIGGWKLQISRKFSTNLSIFASNLAENVQKLANFCKFLQIFAAKSPRNKD